MGTPGVAPVSTPGVAFSTPVNAPVCLVYSCEYSFDVF